jgi:hypothetical protein
MQVRIRIYRDVTLLKLNVAKAASGERQKITQLRHSMLHSGGSKPVIHQA